MIGKYVRRYASGLRFPTLFLIVGALFVIDVLVPDVIPFFDEIMLALTTLLLAALKKPKSQVP
jgi:Family of unknown function (DUF6116)